MSDTRTVTEYKYVKKTDFPTLRTITGASIRLLKLWANMPRGQSFSLYKLHKDIGLKDCRSTYYTAGRLLELGLITVPLKEYGQKDWDGTRITDKGRRMLGYSKYFDNSM